MEVPEDYGADLEREDDQKKRYGDYDGPHRPIGAVASVIAKTAAIMAGISSLITAVIFVLVGAEELAVSKIAAVAAAVTAAAYFLVLFSVRGGFHRRHRPPED